MKSEMDPSHSQMPHPPFSGPCPPRPRFPNNPLFYPPSAPPFSYPSPLPHFRNPLPDGQFSSSFNSRQFPEANSVHHLYPIELTGNHPPSSQDHQASVYDSTQNNTVLANRLECDQQHYLENSFSGNPDPRMCTESRGSYYTHEMYGLPPLHDKAESTSDCDSLKTGKELPYPPLIQHQQSGYGVYELPVDKAVTYPEEINYHYRSDLHSYARREYSDEPYKNPEGKLEGGSLCKERDFKEEIDHSKSSSNEKKGIESLKKLIVSSSNERKISRNVSREKESKEKGESRNCDRGRKRIGNHSSSGRGQSQKDSAGHRRSEDCSGERKKPRDCGYDRRISRNLSSERKQSRNGSHEREKSRNSSRERNASKDQRREKQMPGDDVGNFKNPNDECKGLRNISRNRERSRNVSREREKSRNVREREKSRNISRERERSRNASRERSRNASRERSRNASRERSRNASRERSRNASRERERSRNASRERERSRNASRERERSRNASRERERARNASRERRNVSNERRKNPISEKKEPTSFSHKREREKSRSTEKKKPRLASQERSRSYSCGRKTAQRDVISPKRSRRYYSQDERYRSCTKRSDSKSSERHNTKHSKPDKSNDRCTEACNSHARSPETSRQNSKSDTANSSATKYTWMRSSPAELYYVKDENNPKVLIASQKLKDLHQRFDFELVKRAERIKLSQPKYEPPRRKTKLRKPKPAKMENEESSSTSEESSSEEEDTSLEELERKKKHPYRLHEELWYNDPGEMNDGPLCRCSAKARRSGIRHGIYAGESSISLCDLHSNNADKLHHYRISITPTTNFLSETPTTIHHDGNDFMFEGFSILSHFEIPELPPCKMVRFNIEYTVHYVKEKFPENFTVAGLEILSHYLFTELLELVDLNWKAFDDSSGCHRFHLLPRFTRDIEANGKELLSLNVILQYLLDSNKLLIEKENMFHIMSLRKHKWQDIADEVKGMIVTCPGMKPSSIRVDQLDRELCDPKKNIYPEIVHFGVRPPQLSYAGNPNYQKAWRDYVKFRHLLANKPKVIYADRHRLLLKERRLQEMRMKNNLKRDVTVVVSSDKFYKTGILCDVVQHAMLLPVLICHLRFHQSLDVLEARIGYKFKDRYLLQLALTHPSYRENFGTNPDHARNSLTNCGIRQPEYGDRRIHYMNTRKRGINTLINIMSRFGRREETTSRINHNERLEFLGDAVVEFLSSIHLFFMFSNLEEGGLATYRAAIVQNQHLAVLAKNLQLEEYMLYAHGSDLCHDLELRHAMANCFEALMGALFLDGGIDVADRVFSETLFTGIYLEEWVNYPLHPLQELEPNGDRKWIPEVEILQKLSKFEESTGVEFTHIRLLARAMTHRSLGYNNLTMGSNQRLEFLGDTVLQLVASEYLYKYFPEHHEGHLSLLRSSLVNNRTQAVVCDDLGMVEYAIYPYAKVELKAKDRADLLEAFLGALYVDKDLGYCTKFCEVCFFPRLQDFIMNQEWNDPKSKLQQCCLTLRTMDGGEPDIPVYKVIECKGPTNTRVYSVAVYFRRRRLAVGSGHSIQQAEMSAAENALGASKDLFPQLDHQRRAIEKSLNQRKPTKSSKRERKRK